MPVYSEATAGERRRRDAEIPDRLEAARAAALRLDSEALDLQRSLVEIWLRGQGESAWARTVRRSLAESLEAYAWRCQQAAGTTICNGAGVFL